MGNWASIVSQTERERYCEILAATHPIYAAANLRGLNRLLDEREGRAFLYTETHPGQFHILLLMTPVRGDTQRWKIVNAIPTGEFDPVEAAKIVGRKVRAILDHHNATSLYGTPLSDYGDPRLNRFFQVMPELFWEFEAEEESSHGKFRMRFRRTSVGKSEDENFDGPRSRRPEILRSTQ